MAERIAGQFDDLWSSSDAIHWQKEADHLPFGKRSGSQVLTFHGKLYLLDSDVWVSEDALHWQQLTPEILPGQQLLGTRRWSLIKKSGCWDAIEMACFPTRCCTAKMAKLANPGCTVVAPWGVAAAVFKDKVYLTGGKYGGTPEHTEFRYDNDLWVMERSDGKK